MKNLNLFPLGVAEGNNFCNREAETKQLLSNIQNCTHTVLISPRRYGKTSLAYRAIAKSKLVNARTDLYMTTNATDIIKAILASVDNILSQISNNAEILLNLIKDYIKSLKPTFSAGSNGLQIKLEAGSKDLSAMHLCEGLQILDGALRKKSMRCVLLIDEFQEIQRVAPDHGIEGAIRHVAQETKHFTVIFSGSHRHLLKSMFNDKSKPLYRLCDEIVLERISEKDYLHFIEKFAQEYWHKKLSSEVIQKIFDYSQCHAYYLNAICKKLFLKNSLPNSTDIDLIWNELIQLKKKDILAETADLNITHKKILVAIAHGTTQEFTGRKFLSQSELSGANVIRALEYLEGHDFIEKKDDKYYLIDPLLRSIIIQLTYF